MLYFYGEVGKPMNHRKKYAAVTIISALLLILCAVLGQAAPALTAAEADSTSDGAVLLSAPDGLTADAAQPQAEEAKGGFKKFAEQWLPYIIAGISNGGQYALIAIGYTMVYGILRLINFAHGDIFMCAGLMMVYLSATLNVFIAIPTVLILTVLLGFLVERCAYKPLRDAPRMSVMISAIGVSYLLQNLAFYITSGLAKQYPVIPLLTKSVALGSVQVKTVTIITPVLTVVLILLLQLLIKKTKIGMAMRAVSFDFETSRLMGVKINSVISMTFIIGSFLAAVGSILFFSAYTTVTPTVGAMPGLKAFVAAVFGGIGSVPGAVIGAFIIGLVENIIKGISGGEYSTFSDAFTFALLIVILVVKPTGLFGEKLKEKV